MIRRAAKDYKCKHRLTSSYNRDQCAIITISCDQIRESKYGDKL